MNKEESRLLKGTFEIIEKYLDELEDPNLQVLKHKDPEKLRNSIDIDLKDDGESPEAILDLMNTYLDNSTKTSAKQFHNQLFAGVSIPSLAGDFLASVLNGSNYTFEASPVGTLVELELIKKMGEKVGFDNPDGTFLTGGSNANLIAMLCARNWKFPQLKAEGLHSLGVTPIFVSDNCHYSFEKAANLMGLGIKNVRYVKTDAKGRMIPEALEECIKDSLDKGENPFFIGATMGTTETGNFDPISEIVDIGKKYDLWVHADGAWGGSILMSDKHKHLLEGVEKADSFTWDAHKMLNVPLICSVVLVNHKNVLENAVSTQMAEYLFHEHDHKHYDLGLYSIQCGKKVDVLKFWIAWKYYGSKGLEQNINTNFENKKWVDEYISSQDDMEFVSEGDSLNVNFRFINPNVEDLNKYNSEIRDRLTKSGKSLCNYCHLDSKFSLRLIVNNPNKTKDDFKNFFDNLYEFKNLVDNEYSSK